VTANNLTRDWQNFSVHVPKELKFSHIPIKFIPIQQDYTGKIISDFLSYRATKLI
jgi:hypothetical protein